MTETGPTVDPFAPDPDEMDCSVGTELILKDVLKPWFIGLTIVFVVIALILMIISLLPVHGDVNIFLQGAGVDDLDPNARVVIGRQPIGHVESIELQSGVPTAHLLIDSHHAKDLPEDTTFKVTTLNKWIPGNLGVVAILPRHVPSATPIQDQAMYTAVNTPLAGSVPARFYLLIGMIILAMIVAVVFARILKSWLLLLSALASLVAVLSYLNVHLSF